MAGRNAVILLSGGLDSATVLAMARAEGFACHALSFDYDQRHRHELEAAQAVGRSLGVASHRVVRVDIGALGDRNPGGTNCALIHRDVAVPKGRSDQQMTTGIPVTYVPARNTLFLSYGLAAAELLGAADLFVGVNAVDYSGYPDCRPAYIEAFERMANLATQAAVEGKPFHVHAPLIDWTKPRIIERGLALGVDYSLTHSCYDPDESGRPCGQCDSCQIRESAFGLLGMEDPVRVRFGMA